MEMFITILAVIGTLVLVWLIFQIIEFVQIRRKIVRILIDKYKIPENWAKFHVTEISGSDLKDHHYGFLAHQLAREYDQVYRETP